MSSYVPPHLRNRAPSAPASVSSAPASIGHASLRQGTMASLTRSSPSQAPVPTNSADEFPEVKSQVGRASGDKKSVWGQATGQRFSDLARSWGVQQKEEEEERKRLAKERITAEQKEREREEKERAYFRIVDPTKVLYGGKAPPQTVYDLGGDQDSLVAEEEEESDVEAEDVVYRRSKHDLY